MLEPVYLLSSLVSFLSDSAYACIVGLLLARAWLAGAGLGAGARGPQVRRAGLLTALAVYLCAHLARPWFVASSMSGTTGFRENLALVPSILTDTHQGRLWFVSSVAALILLVVMLVQRAGWFSTAGYGAALALIAFAKAAAGHAGGDGDYTATALLQMVHILATAVWAGSILVSGFLVLPGLAQAGTLEDVWRYGGRLSKVATFAIIAVAISGIYTSDRELGGTLSGLLSRLWMSPWGKILMTKVALVLIALALGGGSRFLALGKAASEQRLQLFTRLLYAEACAMLLVLCLSGLLGNTSPAMPPMAM